MLQAVIESQVEQVVPDGRDGGANHTKNSGSSHIESEGHGSEGNGKQEADNLKGNRLSNSVSG